MELFIGSLALIAFCNAIIAIDEHINWMASYDEAGKEDRERHGKFPTPIEPTFPIMNEFRPWMDRGIGRWTSRRRYLFGENRTSGDYVTNFELEPLEEEESYRITWSGKTDGEMDLTLKGNKLLRSRSYFDSEDDSGYQEMYWIDSDTVVFHTAYDGTAFREEIRFLDNDTRLRQTVGRDQKTNNITLVGQYFEERVA